MSSPPESLSVAVVTVAFNQDPGELGTFLTTLGAATSRTLRALVVNTGDPYPIPEATDITASFVDHPEGNVGYGRALNFGVEWLQAEVGEFEWLVISNPDIVWAPGTIDHLIAAATITPRAGAVGPRINNDDGSLYPSARIQPSLSIGAGHALFSKVWPGNPWSRAYRSTEKAAEANIPTETGWLSGACLLLRPEAFREVGGFDSRYFMYFEDTDLGDRLTKAGWLNLYVPSVAVTHHQGTSTAHAKIPMIQAHHDSAKQFFNDRWHFGWQAPIRLAVGAGLDAREVWEIRRASQGK